MSEGDRVLAFVAFGLALWTSAAGTADFQYGFTSNVYLENGAVDATGVLQQKKVVAASTPHGYSLWWDVRDIPSRADLPAVRPRPAASRLRAAK